MFCTSVFLFQFSKNLVRIERVNTSSPPGRFDVVLGISFMLGQFVEVPEKSLVDTSASSTGVDGDCRTINRLQWGK